MRMMIFGPTLIGRGLLDGVLEEMEEQGLLYVIYNKVEQNPTDENVEDAVKVFLENGCDCMLALGGGAPLDCAKAVGEAAKNFHGMINLNETGGELWTQERQRTTHRG